MESLVMSTVVLWFTSLFSIINPISTGIISIGFLKSYSKKEKNKVAKKAAIASTLVLILFVFAGKIIFHFFGISLEALRIAGGIFIVLIALRMLNPHEFHKRLHPESHAEALKKDDISIMPLAIPLLSGPGAIATTILHTANISSPIEYGMLTGVIIVIGIISYLCIANASKINNVIGATGTKTLEKILGIILLTIGVQFVLIGIRDYVFLTFV